MANRGPKPNVPLAVTSANAPALICSWISKTRQPGHRPADRVGLRCARHRLGWVAHRAAAGGQRAAGQGEKRHAYNPLDRGIIRAPDIGRSLEDHFTTTMLMAPTG